MGKRVAVLLVRHLSEAVRQRRVEVVDSEPYWLTPEQYRERDDGTLEMHPSDVPDLMTYARQHAFRPLGMVVINEEGDYSDFVDETALPEHDREFALQIFHTHAHYWFIYVPWAAETQQNS